MSVAEMVIIAAFVTVGTAFCAGSHRLATLEKRHFGSTARGPIWLGTLRNCLFGLSIAEFGIVNHATIAQVWSGNPTCPDRGGNIFMLTFGGVLAVGGMAAYRVRLRQDAAKMESEKRKTQRRRPIPAFARVVKLTKEERYPDRPTATTGLIYARNGVAMIILSILALSGQFCWVEVLSRR
jgi:hypothetical protein